MVAVDARDLGRWLLADPEVFDRGLEFGPAISKSSYNTRNGGFCYALSFSLIS